VDSFQGDLLTETAARELVDRAAPDWVVHCAAVTDVDACEADPAMAMRLNRDMAEHLARAAQRRGAAFVFISTDAVFDGGSGGYRESSQPNPVNAYGRSKLAGEGAVLAAHPQAVILRTNLYGWNAQPKRSLAEWFLERCEAGLPSPGWTDVYSTPILANDLAGILLRLLASGCRGIYHVPGATCLTKHDFGRAVASKFGFDPDLIEPAEFSNSPRTAPRPRRPCLVGEKVESALGSRLPTVHEGLDRFYRLRDQGWTERLKKAVSVDVGRS
jgi:dTDP-4-dehydrorhamnose reductase